MLTFEKVLEVFQAYLDDDSLYEVVQTSHGYTLMAWEPHRNDWYSAEIQKTPEDLRNALLDTYANFLEDKITGNDRDRHAGPDAADQRRDGQHQIDARAGHQLAEAFGKELNGDQKRKADRRPRDPDCFFHKKSPQACILLLL